MSRLAVLLALTAATPTAWADEALAELIDRCAPQVHVSTLQAVIATESSGRPFAININGGHRLQRQPVSEEEAAVTARWLYDNGYNFDAGLAQINSKNFEWLGLTPETVFDPCTNISASQKVLTHDYAIAVAARGDTHPVLTALSRYNTGNNTRGFDNGYVGKVRRAAASQARKVATATAPAPTPALSTPSVKAAP